jgi:hypothetical protein
MPNNYVPTPKDVYDTFYKSLKDTTIAADSKLDSEEAIHVYLDNFENLRRYGEICYDSFIGDPELMEAFEDAIYEKFGICSVSQGPDNETMISNYWGSGTLKNLKAIMEIAECE